MAPGAVAPKDPAVKVAAVMAPGRVNEPAVNAPEIVAEAAEAGPEILTPLPDNSARVVIAPPVLFLIVR
jgi:hypothetical protein